MWWSLRTENLSTLSLSLDTWSSFVRSDILQWSENRYLLSATLLVPDTQTETTYSWPKSSSYLCSPPRTCIQAHVLKHSSHLKMRGIVMTVSSDDSLGKNHTDFVRRIDTRICYMDGHAHFQPEKPNLVFLNIIMLQNKSKCSRRFLSLFRIRSR